MSGSNPSNWVFYLKAAIADGNPSYVQSSLIMGIGGRGLVAGRPQSDFGLGVFYYNLSDALQSSLDSVAEFGDEAGIGVFYSWTVTPWLRLSGDLQWINPAGRGDKSSVVAAIRANLRI